MSLVLTREELKALTGYSNPGKQIDWFRRELGLEVPVGADGRPRVSQSVVDQATIARSTGAMMLAQAAPKSAGPKWKVAA